MTRFTLLLAAAATAAVAMIPAAQARDGCGRGSYFNGRACVPMYAPRAGYGAYGYAPRYYGPPRPVMGSDGQISCMNPNYTWQDGACKPYRGR